MITYLSGKVVAQTERAITVCVGAGGNLGVGYEVVCSLPPATVGDLVLYIVHSFSRDGQQTLYGYPDPASRRYGIFAEKTPSVGPKTAHTFVTTVGVDAINAFLYSGVAIKAKVPGVSAANCAAILEMIRKQVEKDGGEGLTVPTGTGVRTRRQLENEILTVLGKLGFGMDFARAGIATALRGFTPDEINSANISTLVDTIANHLRNSRGSP